MNKLKIFLIVILCSFFSFPANSHQISQSFSNWTVEEKNITASQGNDYDFSWDPDGKRITFVSEREDNPEIFVIDVTLKQDPIRLTDNNSIEYSPVWKDNKIIFISDSDIVMLIPRRMSL